jgi:hypothetical protein
MGPEMATLLYPIDLSSNQYACGVVGRLKGETLANLWRLTLILRMGGFGAAGALGALAAALATAAVLAN